MPRVFLSGDRALEGLKISNPRGDSNHVGLRDHKLTIGERGIVFGTTGLAEIGGGILTSSSGQLGIFSILDSRYLPVISSVISDNGKQRVGVDLLGDGMSSKHRGVELGGRQSNTFAGDFNIKTNFNVNLMKEGGAIAISGNLNITNGGEVRILRNEQIDNKSRVLIKSGVYGVSTLQLNGRDQADITETFHQLTVDGRNVLDFGGGDDRHKHGLRKLFLDDLEILDGGKLDIRSWVDQRDFLLVRKDSAHLKDALEKLHFEGYQNRVHLVDYNEEYFEVSNAPEPAAYGSIIGALVAGLTIRRRKRRLFIRAYS